LASQIRAYAKVNLHLEVLNRRKDGYHNIFSLMANVALYDLLKLESLNVFNSRNGAVNVTIDSVNGSHKSLLDSIPVRDNLITKAATAYLEKSGLRGDVVFSIQKNIPAGAGLAGGSSDAAAALKLLNEQLSGFSPEALMSLGSELGADVPYCLKGGFAVCLGIGDIVRPVAGSLPYWVLIVNDGIHVDTGSAYRALKRSEKTESGAEKAIEIKTGQMVDAISKGSIEMLRRIAANDFEKPVFEVHPAIGKLKEKLYGFGADFSAMTGSGSSVIAIFMQKKKAEEAQTDLKGVYKEVILTHFV
jgi:4-diphosphocytidyl-2-C-methyl-D-erythritol kinase